MEYDPRSGGFFTKKHKGRPPAQTTVFNEGSRSVEEKWKKSYASNTRSRFDTDILWSETSSQSRSRFVPYKKRDERPGYVKGKRFFDSHPARASNNNRGGGNETFFKVTVFNDKTYNETWLLNTLQKASSVPFTPLKFFSHGTQVHFFVNDPIAAEALKAASKTLKARDNIKIKVNDPPEPFHKSEMTDEDIEHFKNCMQKRFDRSQMAMDLKALCSDSDLVANHVDMILSRRCSMLTMLRIIEDNVPELLSLDLSNNKLFTLKDLHTIDVKAPKLKILNLSNNSIKREHELDKIRSLKLEELWLEGNPFCQAFPDKSLYISAIRDRFPKLLRLDGEELPPPISFDLETPTELPPCKGSYFENDEAKTLVLQFLQQYYTCYDGEDRQGLLNVYHDEACCSVTISPGPVRNKYKAWDYIKANRNLRTSKDLATRLNLLKHKRLNIVGFLNELPRTLHVFNSFVVDINVQTNSLLCFVVNGVFKEVAETSRISVRAFSRTFVALPDSDGGLLLVNDELFIRNARYDEVKSAFLNPAPTASSSPGHHDMVQAFILFSGMNSDWSQKCLQENDWDFDKAAQIFLNLKAEGKIPDVAFIKCPTP
uniref:Nuclear RNA export factor 1 n=1 Tax=Leptobrachium leishanense TaxID=445787 RepID=A0A8C5QZX1_9ANUR